MLMVVPEFLVLRGLLNQIALEGCCSLWNIEAHSYLNYSPQQKKNYHNSMVESVISYCYIGNNGVT